MSSVSRRDFLYATLALGSGLVRGAEAEASDLHRQILEIASKQQDRRRLRFAAVKTKADLDALQKELRHSFLTLLDGLPEPAAAPPVHSAGSVAGDDYVIEKFTIESFPGYHVPALLYRPKKVSGRLPAILSPCGHSAVGKAAASYQILHINLAKRGNIVLTYDPVGQGERSQFWQADARKSRYNLTCGEHCVLGNPLYLLGTSLARYRIWDGMRALDHLVTRDDVDPKKIGCVGNSGGGTLTAYIAALDPRVQVPVIGCYITNLTRRMGNRIETDPDSDPEQDVFGFVQRGIDHAGLLALMAPRPTLLCTARLDFFPIEGARETFAEVQKLYATAGNVDRIEKVEAEARHGLTLPLRHAAYRWFARWLHGEADKPVEEIAVKPRAVSDLLVCTDGQVSLKLKSRPLLPLALEQFQKRKKGARVGLKELLQLDADLAAFHLTEAAPAKADAIHLLCINGNDSGDWREEKEALRVFAAAGLAVSVVDPRGVGKLRPNLQVKGRDYSDPLCGVEENLAYNAFLVGKSLVGMRVADVLAAIKQLRDKVKPRQLVLCGRRDAAMIACLAAALEPAVHKIAVEAMPLSFLPLFAEVRAVNAALLVPGLLRDFGDVADVLAQVAPRKILAAACTDRPAKLDAAVHNTEKSFSKDPSVLTEWVRRFEG